jgi:hypothetical protein
MAKKTVKLPPFKIPRKTLRVTKLRKPVSGLGMTWRYRVNDTPKGGTLFQRKAQAQRYTKGLKLMQAKFKKRR